MLEMASATEDRETFYSPLPGNRAGSDDEDEARGGGIAIERRFFFRLSTFLIRRPRKKSAEAFASPSPARPRALQTPLAWFGLASQKTSGKQRERERKKDRETRTISKQEVFLCC